MRQFENQLVLITGGANGIGRATAPAFAREGAQVVVSDLDDAAGEETVSEEDWGRVLRVNLDGGYVAQ